MNKCDGKCQDREEKFKMVYEAINKMLMRLGMEGEVSTLDETVCDVMTALSDIDGGVYKADIINYMKGDKHNGK